MCFTSRVQSLQLFSVTQIPRAEYHVDWHSARSWAIFVTNQLIWTLLNLGANLKVWGYYCNQTSLLRTARHHQRSAQGKPIDLQSPLQLILRLKGIILVLQISLVTKTMHKTYVCAPDHSKNISTNRPWNAIKTHAVVVYDTRALAEYSSTVFQLSSDLFTNKIDFCEQWSTFWYRLLSFVNCVLFKVCLRFVQGIVRFFFSETS